MSVADFLEMTTTSIAGVSGNGAVTCTALTGQPSFTNIFGSGTRQVRYVIEDTVNGYYEKGFGTVAANVLTRSAIRATWNGAAYNNTSAAALAFGSAPASGAIRIRLAATIEGFYPVVPAINTTIGSDTYKGYQFSADIQSGGNPGAPSGVMGTAVEWYVPYRLIFPGKVDGFGLHVITAGTGGNGIKGALYEVGGDGLPGPCITQFNAIDVGSTGWKTDTTPGTWAVNAGPLTPGVGDYIIGLMTNDAAVKMASWNSGQANRQPGVLGRADGYGYGCAIRKTAENSYATGLPAGTPSQSGGAYTLFSGAGSNILNAVVALRINN